MAPDYEELYPLGSANQIAPPAMRNLHSSTWIRWALRGVGNPRVRLHTVKIGGRRYTDRQSIIEFLAALNGKNSTSGSLQSRSNEFAQLEQSLIDEGL